MIRLFVLSVAILASFLNTFADNRNRSEMLRIAQEKFATKSMAKGSSIIDNEVKIMKDTDQFAIYGAKGSGFIVVSRSNTFPPIIGESTH
ncbi:MAG: Spi family protease inhibitor, partial [Prevotella sp.]|nr:Spi family protease inhibitor [Prevotella sp.]